MVSKEVFPMVSALEGIKVIDLSQVAAVPMCARHLADFGADVIHIENPATGDSWRFFQEYQARAMAGAPSPINYNWETYNRNKRSLALDMAKEGGRGVLDGLLAKADVFLSNMRESELSRYHLHYEDLKKVNPRIICGYLSGYGRKGPDKGFRPMTQRPTGPAPAYPLPFPFPGSPCWATARPSGTMWPV
jgi:cinnamoyl-CoA:phenyllactate CoA-transferase